MFTCLLSVLQCLKELKEKKIKSEKRSTVKHKEVRNIGALMVDAFELDGLHNGCITFKKVWWEDHHGLEF